jgi:hypothetical protein
MVQVRKEPQFEMALVGYLKHPKFQGLSIKEAKVSLGLTSSHGVRGGEVVGRGRMISFGSPRLKVTGVYPSTYSQALIVISRYWNLDEHWLLLFFVGIYTLL